MRIKADSVFAFVFVVLLLVLTAGCGGGGGASIPSASVGVPSTGGISVPDIPAPGMPGVLPVTMLDSGTRYLYQSATGGVQSAYSYAEALSKGTPLANAKVYLWGGDQTYVTTDSAYGSFSLKGFYKRATTYNGLHRFAAYSVNNTPLGSFTDILHDFGPGTFGTVQRIAIIPGNITLGVDQYFNFFVFAYDEHDYPMRVVYPEWLSSNTSLGIVDYLGGFHALAAGTLTLTATYNNLSASATVSIQGASDGTGDVSGHVYIGEPTTTPFPNAYVMIMPTNPWVLLGGLSSLTRTDSNGAYSLPGIYQPLPNGSYYLYAFGFYDGKPYMSAISPAPVLINGTTADKDIHCFDLTGEVDFPTYNHPVIDNLDPNTGPIGATVTINGRNFGPTQEESMVSFNYFLTTPVSFWSDTKIVCTVPFESGNLTASGPVLVIVNGIQSNDDKIFTVTQPPAPPGNGTWTFMVYMDGTNSLDSYGDMDLAEMMTVGSRDKLNILVQQSKSSQNGKARRLLVNPGSVTELSDLGVVDMADPATLHDFIDWGMNNYPADYYAVVLWNHGGGWRDAKGILQDTVSGNYMNMLELKSALTDLPARIHLLICDACEMQMVEVGYQVKNFVDYLVASEEDIPGSGMPYNTILQEIPDNPGIDPVEFSGAIVTDYLNAYSSGVTLSVLRLSKIDELAVSINTFANALLAGFDTYSGHIISCRNTSQSYGSNTYIDLYDFADRITHDMGDIEIKGAAILVKDDINRAVVYQGYKGTSVEGSHGVSINFPKTSPPWTDLDGLNYTVLDFIADNLAAPLWYDFLVRYNP